MKLFAHLTYTTAPEAVMEDVEVSPQQGPLRHGKTLVIEENSQKFKMTLYFWPQW